MVVTRLSQALETGVYDAIYSTAVTRARWGSNQVVRRGLGNTNGAHNICSYTIDVGRYFAARDCGILSG